MSRIRGRGNKDTELALTKLLRSHGITGWRRQAVVRLSVERSALSVGRSGVSIRPDFLFPKQRVAVFVDGCFWHGCPRHSSPKKWLKKSSMGEAGYQPSVVSGQLKTAKGGISSAKLRRPLLTTENRQLRTGKAFWKQKLAANIARDRFVNQELCKQGWKVVRIWEHELPQGRRTKYEGRKRVVKKIRRALAGADS